MRRVIVLCGLCACADGLDPKRIDTGSPNTGPGGTTSAGPGGSTSTSTPTGSTGAGTTPTGTATGSTPTGTTTTPTGWVCRDATAVPVDVAPLANTCPIEITPAPDPWTLTCGPAGTFRFGFGGGDPFPMECTVAGWAFECLSEPTGSSTRWSGTFPTDDRMLGDVRVDVDDPGCFFSYTWTVSLR